MLEEPQVSRLTGAPSNVADAYDRWSRQYDDDQNATRDLDALVLRQAPLQLAGARVLEVGCGTGKNSAWLVTQARELIALDFSPGMLDVARRRVRASTARFVEHDITRPWPAEAGSVDVVVGNLVLEHVRDLAPVFREAARVLRVGGQLFICELHPYRQLRGGQAHFVDQRTDEIVHVAAYTHTVSEYVTDALAAGFTLCAVGEWLEHGADSGVPPRLLSLLFKRE
jgi:ubiquinone/menaquinone biosynthesis C-methylase UbiE